MQFEHAQKDMNNAYLGGATGALISGLVWTGAGFTAMLYSNLASILFLFFGGMFIFPLSMLLSKALKRTGNHTSNNPLGKLALESTMLIFIGLFLAYSVWQIQPAWFYPIMLLIIGGRYLMFNTLYGAKTYWALGGVLIVCGASCIIFGAPFVTGAFLGGAIEVAFAFFIFNANARIKEVSI